MVSVNLKFKRKAMVEEVGGCSVEVKDPRNMLEIYTAANALAFKEFLITERTYDFEDWEFEPLEQEIDEPETA